MSIKKGYRVGLIVIWCLLFFSTYNVYPETVTVQATGIFAVSEIFGIEFYTDSNVLYSNNVPFTNMDALETFVYPDGRSSGDGKSDNGIVCKSNVGSTWYLKLHGEPTAPFTLAKIYYYLSQPWNRTEGATADGQLAQGSAWYNLPSSSTVVYTAGTLDKMNTPDGTLCMFSFAINPSGLKSGTTYSCTVIYTLTVTP